MQVKHKFSVRDRIRSTTGSCAHTNTHSCDSMWVATCRNLSLPPTLPLAKLWEFRNFRGLMWAPQKPFPSSCHSIAEMAALTQHDYPALSHNTDDLSLRILVLSLCKIYWTVNLKSCYKEPFLHSHSTLYCTLLERSLRHCLPQWTYCPMILQFNFLRAEIPIQCTSLPYFRGWISLARGCTTFLSPSLSSWGKERKETFPSQFLLISPSGIHSHVFFIIWQATIKLSAINGYYH